MDKWVHCSKCFGRFEPHVKFFIKECGRVECQKCLKVTGEGESYCVVCNKSDKTILLANNMKADVLNFFKPMSVILDNAKKVYEFQVKHRNDLLEHLSQKYSRAKEEVMKCYKTIDAYKKENGKMKAMLTNNRYSTPGRFSTSTPLQRSTPTMSNFDGSLSTVPCTPINHLYKPGQALRVSPLDRNSSTVSSLEHAVPTGFGHSGIVPTHRSGPRTPMSSLASQMMQNSHFVPRRR